MPSPDRTALITATAFWLLLTVAFGIYAPGLSGGFLFDDLINLDALGRLGGIDNWRTLIDYLFGSHTGTGGRPVALASFLIDGLNWPTNPRPFKSTNILLHLLTMVGVIWLSLHIAGALGYDRRRQCAIALIAGAAWGLHPYLVSTVLYVVQRMAILAALFVVFGLGCYVYGRRLLAEGRHRAGYAWMTTGLVVFTPLAFFSKQNGGLLPLLALVLNATVLQSLEIPHQQKRRWRLWRSVFLYLPLAVIAAYFFSVWDERILNGYAGRTFTLGERLLTEGRILLDYLFNLVVPRIQTSGLYYDNYTVSRDLLTPASTLPALITVIGLLVGGFLARHRAPVVSAAVLFFLSGHIIESTFIPLELYFEHRNYLPSVLLAFALAVGIVRLHDSSSLDHPRTLAIVAGVLLISIYSTFTLARSQLWGNPEELALTWEKENPGSIRVQQQSAMVFMNLGLPQRSGAHIAKAIAHHPDNSILRVQYLIPLCITDNLTSDHVDEAEDALERSTFYEHTISQLEALAGHALNGRCNNLATDDVLTLIETALAHSGVRQRSGMIERLNYLRGDTLLATGRTVAAQEAFMAAARSAVNVEGALQMAGRMASTKNYDYAMTLLAHAEADLARSSSGLRTTLRHAAIDYETEIKRMRSAIQRNAENRATE